MITKGDELEWDDGTPVDPKWINWDASSHGNLFMINKETRSQSPFRSNGYYNYKDGAFTGWEIRRDEYQGVRAVVRGPEPYEEWLR